MRFGGFVRSLAMAINQLPLSFRQEGGRIWGPCVGGCLLDPKWRYWGLGREGFWANVTVVSGPNRTQVEPIEGRFQETKLT